VTSDGQGRVSIHEAGHCVAAITSGWSLHGVTVEAGTYAACCARVRQPALPATTACQDLSLPFALWEPGVRSWIERKALVIMAGGVGELELAPRSEGRFDVPLRDQAMTISADLDLAADLPISVETAAQLRSAVDSDTDACDADALAKLAWLAHGSDFASQGAWMSYLEVQCRALVRREARSITMLADVLSERPTLSGAAVQALLASWLSTSRPMSRRTCGRRCGRTSGSGRTTAGPLRRISPSFARWSRRTRIATLLT
jgi:hypothetical protein